VEKQRKTEDDTLQERSTYKGDPRRMFQRRRSGRTIAEHGRLGFLESENIDSTYVSPTLSVSSVLVADMDNKSMCLPILLKTEDGKKVETQALIDCGARGTFIDKDFAYQNGFTTEHLNQPIQVFNVDGTPNIEGTIEECTHADLVIDGERSPIRLMLAGLGKQRVILGLPWLRDETHASIGKLEPFSYVKDIPSIDSSLRKTKKTTPS